MAINFAMPVLVVDDYATMVRIIRNLLQQIGFTDIDAAMSGLDGLNLMKERKYGLVICDYEMEGMTGLDLLKVVRADQDLAATPFIMISAHSSTQVVIDAKRAGANNFIVKPFNAATLRKKIEEVFPN